MFSKVHPQLESNVSGFMGSKHDPAGVLPHVRPETEPARQACLHEGKEGPGAPNIPEYRRPRRERGIGGRARTSLPRLVQQAIFSPKVQRGDEDRHRLVSTEQVLNVSSLQNDHHKGGHDWSKAGTVGSLNRLEGCLLPSAYAPGVPEVPEGSLARSGLPVQGVTLRVKRRPMAIHSSGEAGGGILPEARHPGIRLPGRLAHRGRHQGTVSEKSGPSSEGHSRSGFSGQQGEIYVDPISNFHLPGHVLRPTGRESETYRETDPRCDFRRRNIDRHRSRHGQEMAFSPWSTEFYVSHGDSRSVERETYTGLPPLPVASSLGELGGPDHSTLWTPPGGALRVVDEQGQLVPGYIPVPSSAGGPFIYGCQPLGLGGTFGRPGGQWNLDGDARQVSHQPLRDVSGGKRSAPFPPPHPVVACPPVFGQHYSAVLPEERGGDALRYALTSDGTHSLLVPETSHHTVLDIYSGQSECEGRSSVAKRFADSGRVGVTPRGGGQSPQPLGTTNDRPVRHTDEHKTPDIRQPVSRSTSVGHGRADVGLGRDQRLRFSPLRSARAGSAQILGHRDMHDDLDRPLLAVTELVSVTAGCSGSITSQPTNMGEHRQPARLSDASESSMARVTRVEIIQRSLHGRGFSEDVASFVVGSTRQSSRQCYDGKWAIYMDWCDRRKIDSLSPSVGELADFLIFLFKDRKAALSTIQGYRSALSHTWLAAGVRNVAADPVISKLITGFGIERPRIPVCVPPWNLSVVLHYLMGPPFEPIIKANVRSLTLKAVFLLAFATAARRSELHALSVADGHCAFSDNFSVLTLRPEVGFLAKNQAPEEVRSPWVIKALRSFVGTDMPDRFLCPVRALSRYLDAVAPYRGGRTRLFLSMQPNRREISRATISSWIAKLIRQALTCAESSTELRAFSKVTAHQVRAMATSWSAFSGASIQDIREAAFWKGQSTFSSFYLRDLSSQVGEISALKPLVAAQSVCQL